MPLDKNFSLTKEERGLYFAVHVTGEFSVQNLLRIREVVEEGMSIGHVNIVFNMEKVIMIDSSGIGLLVNLNQKLVSKGGSVFLVAIPVGIQKTIEPSGILQVLPILASLQDADKHIG